MINYLNELIDAGVTSFKVEGRMKSVYYVATVINAYRRAIDSVLNGKPLDAVLIEELEKTSHRRYTTGFYFKANDKEYLEDSMPIQTHEFMALVKEDASNGYAIIEQRNRFKIDDELEILSTTDTFNKIIVVEEMLDENNEQVEDANKVQQTLKLKTDYSLKRGDILRKRLK